MSEEILKALTQLFAIITKQDGGVTEKERKFVISFFQQELDQDSVKEYLELYDKFVGYNKEEPAEEEKKKERKLTSVKDSVKTLAICKKINKTLSQKQKVVVLIKLLELVGSDQNFTPQRMEIIDTVSTVFNISKEEYKLIESFVLYQIGDQLDFEDMLMACSEKKADVEHLKYVLTDVDGEILFMQIRSVDMYFVKYLGQEEIIQNGFIMKNNHVYLFSHGSTIKIPKGSPLYYSDLIRHFIADFQTNKISFKATDIEFRFSSGDVGLRHVNIIEGPGKLIGIMGASGAGKTTLLNVLAGINKPSQGKILINGIDINSEKDKEKIQGVIGYVSQDDLLIEELTVYENLYYNAKLCFAQLNEEALDKKVMEVLASLGLDQRKDIKVGSVLDKKISGGQRKRLNIALELIREPSVLFVDEPTSGLSSRDSENVIDLLKELTLKGKLIFVVIHQPSSDIYKMFDKMIIMDVGGYPVFYGHPVEAVTYFKKASNQVDSEKGQCPACGNVNPEQIFNIIDAKVVDEYGEFTNKRKINSRQWFEHFIERFKPEKVEDIKEIPESSLHLPTLLKQALIFTKRDMLAKISNKQYMLINFLEAPLLAFILAFIIKYKSAPDHGSYLFRFNENFPVYLMMSIIVALFMGLTVSAEEIIRDRKILKREAFLNLSWNSYLVSKLFILFSLSAIQTLTFVMVGNLILEIHGMTFSFWLVMFTVSCFANILGLNISSSFNSAVTVYILIPLLIIPQMVLSGLLFSFDKLNEVISTKGKVPIVADLMTSRWAYEAIAVDQFVANDYEQPFYQFEKAERQSDFKASYFTDKLKEKVEYVVNNISSEDPEVQARISSDLNLLKNELIKEPYKVGMEAFDLEQNLQPQNFTQQTADFLFAFLENMRKHYLDHFNLAVQKKEKLIYFYENNPDYDYNLNEFKNRYYNENLADLVRNLSIKDRIIEYEGNLIQQIDPIFKDPELPAHILDYRTHFFAPKKHFLGIYFDTYFFNLFVIWGMSIILYIALYFEGIRKMLSSLGNLNLRKFLIKK
ncbi:MAG: ATP-binding cassette domain-containing protein [Candidatus Cyclobacteriaceae bacterium M3_2C_046]